jgi:phospholipase C
MFGHAASSGGLDHSPTTEEIVEWETIGGFQFKSGSIFDALKKKGRSCRLYAGDDFPMVAALKGILTYGTTTISRAILVGPLTHTAMFS